MSVIVTADLHLNDNPRDADRWNLFPWLRKQVIKYKATHVFLLGDITDDKNRHDAALVNRIVDNLMELSKFAIIVILVGNHDFIDEKSPFFAFLHHFGRRIKFTTSPSVFEIPELGECLFLPCTRNYRKEWKDLDFESYPYIFTHQSYDGCISENGTKLKGIPPSVFADIFGKVYSGDVHVAQKVTKNIEYVGAPYRINFGDEYKPRALVLRARESLSINFPAQGRELLDVRSIEQLKEHSMGLELGTQVKVRYHLKRKDYPDWPKIRKEIKALIARRGWQLYGLQLKTIKVKTKQKEKEESKTNYSPTKVIQKYAERKKLGESLTTAGLSLIKEASRG